MTSANIRIRPIRFGFLVDPKDATILRNVLQMNACLWGGVYNFLIPVPRKRSIRYGDYFVDQDAGWLKLRLRKGTGPTAQQLTDGLLEAFEPDLLVETKTDLARQIRFDKARVLTLEQFNEEENGRRKYGIDLISVCAALYEKAFRFVQRHPPKVVDPRPTDRKYGLLFAAAFGEFPTNGSFAECKKHFRDALDAKEREVDPLALHELFASGTIYPLRAGAYRLEAFRGWSSRDPTLFYMDENNPYDIIEYWNLRALGWRITPLPHLLAPKLGSFCEKFILESHRPYPPPSNASENATFLCSRSCAFHEMQVLVSSLKRPDSHSISVDFRIPRLWEEWGRHADHADAQVIECETKSVDVFSFGSSISIGTSLPEFVEEDKFISGRHACTNIIADLPGGAPVIPWQMIDMGFIAGQLREQNIWVGREGICMTAGAYGNNHHLKLPSAFNVFAAWAQRSGFEIELSPAGKAAEQLISALGGLTGVRTIGDEELIKILDRMANGTLEVEISENQPTSEKRRLKKSSIPLHQIQPVLDRINRDNKFISDSHLSNLLSRDVLILGMEVACSYCDQKTWFSLEQLAVKLKCQRCLRDFDFPLTAPHKNTWSYRVQGPFAIEDYAHGAAAQGR
jgi:hypothetical protein